jgi:hypothetical protein
MEVRGQLPRRGRFNTGSRIPGTQWTGGSVCPTTGLDALEQTKVSSTYHESNPGRPVGSYTNWTISATRSYKQANIPDLNQWLFIKRIKRSRCEKRVLYSVMLEVSYFRQNEDHDACISHSKQTSHSNASLNGQSIPISPSDKLTRSQNCILNE